MWPRWMVLLACVLLVGCGESPAERVGLVQDVTTDGDDVIALADVTFSSSRLLKFDADGNLVWERRIGPSYQGGSVHDDYLYIVEHGAAGDQDREASSPDRLLKMDLETGDTVDSRSIGPRTNSPRMIDGKLWLLSDDRMAFEIVDPETLEVVETLNVRTGDILEESDVEFIGGALYPVAVDDHVFFVADDPKVIVKYSIERREIEGVQSIQYLLLRGWPEVHDGVIWLRELGNGGPEVEGWLAYPLDPERLEVGEPVPFLESPLWTLTTDEFVFDQTGIDEITQIDRDTGETLRTIAGRHPQFVLDNHLWLANLERVELE